MVARVLLLLASVLVCACSPIQRGTDAQLPALPEDGSALQTELDRPPQHPAVVPAPDLLPGRFFALVQPVGDGALTPAGVACVSAHRITELPLPAGSTLHRDAHVVYEGTPTTLDHLTRLIDLDESVAEVRIRGDVPAAVLNNLRLPSVRYLRFDNVRPTNLMHTFSLSVERFPRLVHVGFYNCHALSDDMWQEVADHPELVGVTVINCNSISGRGISGAAGLSELMLDLPEIDDGVAEELATLSSVSRLQLRLRTLANLDSLNRLAALPNLYGLDLLATDAVLKAIAELRGLASLRLSVSDSVTDEGIEHIRGMATIEELWLDGGRAVNLLADKTLQTLASLPNLRGLSLTRGAYTDAGFRYLESANKLATLILYEVALTEASLSSIARLKGLRHLELLHSPRENDRALLELGAASELQYLKVWAGTVASEEATLAALGARLPNLTISRTP